MKNRIYLFTLILCLSLSLEPLWASVFRVNNGLTENISGGVFTTLQRAHDNFTTKNGDTLMVESSGKEYGDAFTCTKRLVIIGPGYFLGENSGVNSVVASASLSGGIRFQNGSQGSYFIGMETTYSLTVSVNNIYIIRSKLNSIYVDGAAGCKFTMSYITSLNSYRAGADISVTNSIIVNDYSSISYVNFDNNILVGKSNQWEISAGTFRNNILIDRESKIVIKSPNIQNNLAPNAQFGTDHGNRAYEAADLFVGGTSSDGKYKLKPTSPYVAAGYGGTQPGIFGGPEPYKLSGIPPIPIIYELNVPGTGSAATGLPINIKIRGAN